MNDYDWRDRGPAYLRRPVKRPTLIDAIGYWAACIVGGMAVGIVIGTLVR